MSYSRCTTPFFDVQTKIPSLLPLSDCALYLIDTYGGQIIIPTRPLEMSVSVGI